MINQMKTLPGEINKDDYKCQNKFFQERVKVSFIHEYLAPQSYSDINSHTSCFFEIFKFNCNHQKYLNTKIFVNRVAIAKIRSASCKLMQLQANGIKCA